MPNPVELESPMTSCADLAAGGRLPLDVAPYHLRGADVEIKKLRFEMAYVDKRCESKYSSVTVRRLDNDFSISEALQFHKQTVK